MTVASDSSGSTADTKAILRRFRIVLGLFIVGLVLSGVTAFPLLHELDFLCSFFHFDKSSSTGLWLLTVRDGLRDIYGNHPWMAYGTDWLAFAHIVLAVFFIGPFIAPARNIWVLQAGLAACVLVIPLAMIAGPIRGIPWGWRLIDCSFGVFGSVPLYCCLRWAAKLEKIEAQNRSDRAK